MKTIGVIGFGNMGSALCGGLKKKKDQFKVIVAEKLSSKAELARKKYKLSVVASKELINSSDIIVIAVKPQELAELLEQISPYTKTKSIISIVAGRKISLFKDSLGTDQVARFMPNLAAMKGKAAVGVSFSKQAKEDFKKQSLQIAGALGLACQIPESLMPAITGLSGSGIAFVFAFIHALALGGVAEGIKYDQAVEIASATVQGAVTVLKSTKMNPVELLSKVISPAGTTIRGVTALEKLGFTHATMQAVVKASKRARDLEG